jgi:hypothetical protein
MTRRYAGSETAVAARIEGLSAMQKENGCGGHMIFWQQVLGASYVDRIRRKRCGCIALRSVPAINDLTA